MQLLVSNPAARHCCSSVCVHQVEGGRRA